MWHLLKETIGVKIKQTPCLPPFTSGSIPVTLAHPKPPLMSQCPLAMVGQISLFLNEKTSVKILVIPILIRNSRLLEGE